MYNYFSDIDIFPDGWIFLLGGSNDVKKYWTGELTISSEVVDVWRNIFERRIGFFKSENIKYINIFAPEKLSIYGDKVDFDINDNFIPSIHLINKLSDISGIEKANLNLIPYLRSQSKEYLTYHKTDSHWNFIGAFSAYQMIQSNLGEPIFSQALSQPKNYNWNIMDLGGKLDPPLKEKTFYYNSTGNISRIHANELVLFKEQNNRENDPGLHVGSYVVYKNKEPLSDKVVMIFGDSFSEYRDHLLTGLYAETYSEVHFLWNSSIDFDLVTRVKPDIVISELAERFIPKGTVKC